MGFELCHADAVYQLNVFLWFFDFKKIVGALYSWDDVVGTTLKNYVESQDLIIRVSAKKLKNALDSIKFNRTRLFFVLDVCSYVDTYKHELNSL